jgi:hypothetical protein
VIASEVNESKDILGTLRRQPWDQSIQDDYGFNWQNMFFALIEPQRGYLYGLPLALLILTLLLVGVQHWEWKFFAVAGVIGGTLPLAHTSTLVALALITPFVALSLDRSANLGAQVGTLLRSLDGDGATADLLATGWAARRDERDPLAAGVAHARQP